MNHFTASLVEGVRRLEKEKDKGDLVLTSMHNGNSSMLSFHSDEMNQIPDEFVRFHSIILKLHSEKSEDLLEELKCKGETELAMKFSLMKGVIDYLYNGNVSWLEMAKERKQITDTYNIIDYFQLKGLMNVLETIADVNDLRNIRITKLLGRKDDNRKTFLESDIEYLAVNMKHITSNVQNIQLLSEDFLMRVLEHSKTDLASEDDLVKVILKWFTYDTSTRLLWMPQLLTRIRWEEVSEDEKYTVFVENEYLDNDSICRLIGRQINFLVRDGKLSETKMTKMINLFETRIENFHVEYIQDVREYNYDENRNRSTFNQYQFPVPEKEVRGRYMNGEKFDRLSYEKGMGDNEDVNQLKKLEDYPLISDKDIKIFSNFPLDQNDEIKIIDGGVGKEVNLGEMMTDKNAWKDEGMDDFMKICTPHPNRVDTLENKLKYKYFKKYLISFTKEDIHSLLTRKHIRCLNEKQIFIMVNQWCSSLPQSPSLDSYQIDFLKLIRMDVIPHQTELEGPLVKTLEEHKCYDKRMDSRCQSSVVAFGPNNSLHYFDSEKETFIDSGITPPPLEENEKKRFALVHYQGTLYCLEMTIDFLGIDVITVVERDTGIFIVYRLKDRNTQISNLLDISGAYELAGEGWKKTDISRHIYYYNTYDLTFNQVIDIDRYIYIIGERMLSICNYEEGNTLKQMEQEFVITDAYKSIDYENCIECLIICRDHGKDKRVFSKYSYVGEDKMMIVYEGPAYESSFVQEGYLFLCFSDGSMKYRFIDGSDDFKLMRGEPTPSLFNDGQYFINCPTTCLDEWRQRNSDGNVSKLKSES
ncbi:hypothetical protein SNEBB_005155 [Seison nebaliae]|nr:hypothetical protein SNEBB_005155 [Seison nebaliae]